MRIAFIYNSDKVKVSQARGWRNGESCKTGRCIRKNQGIGKENAELREKLNDYQNRKLSGRQKHDEKWREAYNDFVVHYESGMSVVEIAERNNVSKRTVYRYKAYYNKMKETEDN